MIEILGMTGCDPCLKAKHKLADSGKSFAYYNAKEKGSQRTTELKKIFMASGGTKVPAFFVNGEYKGYGTEALTQIL